MQDTSTQYDAVIDKCQDLFAKKMKDYGISPYFIYIVRDPFERIESDYNYSLNQKITEKFKCKKIKIPKNLNQRFDNKYYEELKAAYKKSLDKFINPLPEFDMIFNEIKTTLDIRL